jgi:hypothetical protein
MPRNDQRRHPSEIRKEPPHNEINESPMSGGIPDRGGTRKPGIKRGSVHSEAGRKAEEKKAGERQKG